MKGKIPANTEPIGMILEICRKKYYCLGLMSFGKSKESVAVPIYEFVCQSCANEFEHIQSFSDSRMPVCPQCQSVQVVRRMGRPAIHFKGSGWYINDSKKKSSESKDKNNVKVAEDGSETKKETTTESTTESKNDGKSESKSDSATETKGGSEKKSESSSTPSTPAPVAAD